MGGVKEDSKRLIVEMRVSAEEDRCPYCGGKRLYTRRGMPAQKGGFIAGVMAKRSILSYIGNAGSAGGVGILFAMGQS